MKYRILIGLSAVLAAAGSFAQTTVASSGMPELVLNRNAASGFDFPIDDTNIILNRLGFSSGNLGAGLEERWTACQFKLISGATINGIEVNWFSSTPPNTYGWAVYGNTVDGGTGEDKPGTLIHEEHGLDYLTLVGGSFATTYANGFLCDITATVNLVDSLGNSQAQTLAAGKYWFTIFGEDGNMPQFVGAYGGNPTIKRSWRKTGVGSAYASSASNAFAMMNGRADFPNEGAFARLADPNDFSAWLDNELNGSSLFKIAYRVFSNTASGTNVSGLINVYGWGEFPAYGYFVGDTTNLMTYDLVFCDPSDGYPITTVGLNIAPDGTFITTDAVQDGTYQVKCYVHPWFIGHYTCNDGVNDHSPMEALQNNLFGRPFLGADLGSVSISGGLVDLGEIALTNGDADLSAQVNLFDLNRILGNFSASLDTTGGCPPNWDAYFDNDDQTGDGNVDLFDLNSILGNFAVSGPARVHP